MKIVLKTGVLFLAVAMLFTACKPDAYKEIGAPRDIVASLQGTWKLTKATQVDEDAARKGFPFKELDITTLYPYTDFVLKFTAGSPATFTTTPGSSPKIIKLASGTWTLDDPNYPKNITLTSGATTEVTTLGGYPVGPSDKLKLKVERKDAGTGKVLITYSYEFAKQ